MRRSPVRFVLWAPVILVGSLMYWTLAAGLGAISLGAVTALGGFDERLEMAPPIQSCGEAAVRDSDPIIVHIEEDGEETEVVLEDAAFAPEFVEVEKTGRTAF